MPCLLLSLLILGILHSLSHSRHGLELEAEVYWGRAWHVLGRQAAPSADWSLAVNEAVHWQRWDRILYEVLRTDWGRGCKRKLRNKLLRFNVSFLRL